jgi:hypothetical protein
MNKQITQLAEQSGLMSKQSTTGAAVYTRAQLQKKRQLEKFAELIVRQCMEVVAKKCASPTAYNALAEHFGVEE